jgi:hypothetical protein
LNEGGEENSDFRVTVELCIDEENMSESELELIEGVMLDLFRMVLDNQVLEGE